MHASGGRLTRSVQRQERRKLDGYLAFFQIASAKRCYVNLLVAFLQRIQKLRIGNPREPKRRPLRPRLYEVRILKKGSTRSWRGWPHHRHACNVKDKRKAALSAFGRRSTRHFPASFSAAKASSSLSIKNPSPFVSYLWKCKSWSLIISLRERL